MYVPGLVLSRISVTSLTSHLYNNEATTCYVDILRRFLGTKQQHIILICCVVS